MHSLRTDPKHQNLLLLHGMFGNPGQWKACADRMASTWRVLRPVLPLLEIEPDDRVICVAGDHMLRMMDAAGMERAVIGGNSLGGHIAIRMALRYPDRVAGMILAGSSGLFERGFEKSIPRRPTETYIRRKMREVFHDEVHVTTALVDEMREFLGNIRRVLHMIRIARCAKRDNLRDLLPGVTCPVLLVWGENDNVTPPSAGKEFSELLPASRLHFLGDCGHVPMVEREDEFNQLVADFLTGFAGGPVRPPVQAPGSVAVIRQPSMA